MVLFMNFLCISSLIKVSVIGREPEIAPYRHTQTILDFFINFCLLIISYNTSVKVTININLVP